MPKATFSFSGHETFPLRFAWLPKAVEVTQARSNIFGEEEAIAEFGVGKNMVRAIRYWGLATSVLEPVPEDRSAIRPSVLGRAIFDPSLRSGGDPYCEDTGTLWLLHWLLCRSPERATLWHFVFGRWRGGALDLRTMQPALEAWLEEHEAPLPSISTLKRDLQCLIGTYLPPPSLRSDLEEIAVCPLAALGLVQNISGQAYLREGRQSGLPPEIFAYSILDFWQRTAPTTETLAVQDVLTGTGSPGRIFLLGEAQAFELIEAIGRMAYAPFEYVETAGMQQLYRASGVKPGSMLASYYRVPHLTEAA